MTVRHPLPRGVALRRWAVLAMIALLLGLSACGKRGSPSAPGPASEITYPRSYPKM